LAFLHCPGSLSEAPRSKFSGGAMLCWC
jgi:hypothetical protein